jgi:hypothetical protein
MKANLDTAGRVLGHGVERDYSRKAKMLPDEVASSYPIQFDIETKDTSMN